MLSATSSRTAGSRNRPGALEHHRAYHLPGAAERDHLRHVGVMGEIENAGGLRNVSPKREGCGERAENPGLGFARVVRPRGKREKAAPMSGSQLRDDQRLLASAMKRLLRPMAENDRSKAAKAGRAG